MTTTIPVSDDTKAEFDSIRTDDFKNWDMFMQHVLEQYRNNSQENIGVDEQHIEEVFKDLENTLESHHDIVVEELDVLDGFDGLDIDEDRLERLGQVVVDFDKTNEEIGRLQDQVSRLEKRIEGLKQ